MAEDIRQKIILDETDAVNGLETLIERVRNVEEALTGVEGSGFDKLNDSINKTDKELKDTEKQVDRYAKKAKEATKETSVWQRALGGIGDEIRIFGRSLNTIIGDLKSFRSGLKTTAAAQTTAATATNATVKALRLFKLALVSTGVGALVVALGSLVAFLTKTQKGIDFVNRSLSGLSAVAAVVIDAAADLGEKIFDAFNNPRQAVKDLGNAITQNIINRFTSIFELNNALSRGFQALFAGKFKEALKEGENALLAVQQAFTGLDADQARNIGGALTQMGRDMASEGKRAAELTGQLQRLDRALKDVEVRHEEARSEIAKYNDVLDDSSKSAKERQEAARKAIDLEKSFLNERLKLKQEELRIVKEQNDLANVLERDVQRERDIRKEIEELVQQSQQLTTTLRNKQNTLIQQGAAAYKKQQEAIAKVNAALTEQIDLITKLAADAGPQDDSPVANIERQADAARQQVEIEFKKLEELAKAAGQNVTLTEEKNRILEGIEQERLEALRDYYSEQERIIKEFEAQVDTDIDTEFASDIAEQRQALQIREQLALSEIDLLQETGDKAISLQLYKEREKLRIQIEFAELRLGVLRAELGDDSPEVQLLENQIRAMQQKFSELRKIGNEFEGLGKEIIGKVFGLDPGSEEVAAIEKTLGSIITNISKALGTDIDRRIEQNKELIDTIRDRAEVVEEELKHEEELAEEGAANRVEAKRKELEELRAAEQEAIRKQRELAAEKLRIDRLQQISSLISAGANIFQSMAGIPFVGIPLAIAAIGAMYAAFASVKRSAKEAAQSVVLYRGGSIGESGAGGFVNKRGRTDRSGRGHRVEDSNLILGGREFVVNEVTSRMNEPFLIQFNKGKFDGVDLLSVLQSPSPSALSAGFSSVRNEIINVETQNRSDLTESAMKKIVDLSTKELINYFRTKEEYVYMGEGKVMRYKEGKKRIIKSA